MIPQPLDFALCAFVSRKDLRPLERSHGPETVSIQFADPTADSRFLEHLHHKAHDWPFGDDCTLAVVPAADAKTSNSS